MVRKTKNDWSLKGAPYDEIFALLNAGKFSSDRVEIHDVILELMSLRGKKATDTSVRQTPAYKEYRFRVVKYFNTLSDFEFGKYTLGRGQVTSYFDWLKPFKDFDKFLKGELTVNVSPKNLKIGSSTSIDLEEFKIPISHGTLKIELPNVYSEDDLRRAIDLIVQIARRKNPNFKA